MRLRNCVFNLFITFPQVFFFLYRDQRKVLASGSIPFAGLGGRIPCLPSLELNTTHIGLAKQLRPVATCQLYGGLCKMNWWSQSNSHQTDVHFTKRAPCSAARLAKRRWDWAWKLHLLFFFFLTNKVAYSMVLKQARGNVAGRVAAALRVFFCAFWLHLTSSISQSAFQMLFFLSY